MASDPKDAIARLKATERNVQQAHVYRVCGVTSEPMVVRHMINQIQIGLANPFIAGQVYAGVKQNGLRISSSGQSGQFGLGAYAWPEGKEPGNKQYVDVRLPAGTALEFLSVSGAGEARMEFFRIMPHPQDGDYVRGSEIVDTNIDPRAIEMYKAFEANDLRQAQVLYDLLTSSTALKDPTESNKDRS